ncbi:MAG: LysM peptidoglycan-binding domain-containing protein [Myxococcota bacterium]
MVGSIAKAATTALAVWMLVAFLPEAAAAQRHHKVRSGHSMSRIARHYNVDLFDLAAHNKMRPNDTLRPGKVLTIPPRGVVYVRPGWNLHKIAKRHGVSVRALKRANRLTKSRGLRAYQRLVLPGYRAAKRRAKRKKKTYDDPEDPGVVKLITRHESASIRLRDAEGNVPREGLEALGRLMTRGEQDEVDGEHVPKARLALLLAAISDHFGGSEIRIVSGWREAGGYTSRRSRHVHGAATDIQVDGASKRAVWNYCRTLKKTGCGFYPRSAFVHVDVRDHNAQWVDWSRPGQRPRYGTLRGIYGKWVPKHKRRRVGRKISNPEDVPLEVSVVDDPVLPEGARQADIVALADGDPSS